MRYTVRKGLESPCMIRGFLSSDYWIFVGCCAAALVLLFLSVRTGIMTGDWTLTLLFVTVSLPLLPVLGHKLRKKARPTKFRESKYGMTVSNLTINRQLLKKKQDERGRGIQHT